MYTDMTKEQFQQLQNFTDDKPLKMLNLLKFKEKVGTETGETAYNEYMKAVQPFFENANAKVLFAGKPEATLIGPTENEWDKVLIVEYATKGDFISMITSQGYPTDLRRQSIEDSRLIMCI